MVSPEQGQRAANTTIPFTGAYGPATEPFAYHDRGTMATIGRSDAVVQLPFGLKLKGLPAWTGWVLLHVMELIGNRSRLATLTNLSVHYLAWPRGLNVIVGDAPEHSRRS